jgi:hypothetical protein
MNMNRRIAMGKVRTAGCALVALGSLVFFASGALADCTCTPVVYAFRHAEDTNPPQKGAPKPPLFHLTPSGEAHANLYVTMLPDIEEAKNFCAVTKVYAATTADKPDGSKSATNAFFTGKPLANEVMSGADPIITVKVKDKKGNLVDGQLYEYLDNWINPPSPPNPPAPAPATPAPSYNTKPAAALREALVATANDCKSSAIFWTSQGLHILGGAIINGTSKVPDKISHFDKDGKPDGPTAPRNAAYAFEPIGSVPNVTGFSDTPAPPLNGQPPLSGYVQCDNHLEYYWSPSPPEKPGPVPAHFIDPTDGVQSYYCGYAGQSNLGGSPGKSCNVGDQCNSSIPNDPSPSPAPTPTIESNKDVKGKICDVTNLSAAPKGAEIYGACN